MDEMSKSQRTLLLREYELHQQAIEKFDGHRLQIRNWAVVVVVATLTFAYTSDSPVTALIAMCGAVAFAVSEALHMAITLSVIQRATELEPLLAPDASVKALAAYRFGVSSAYRDRTTLLGAARLLMSRSRWHITFFYVALTLGAALSALIIVGTTSTSNETSVKPGPSTSQRSTAP